MALAGVDLELCGRGYVEEGFMAEREVAVPSFFDPSYNDSNGADVAPTCLSAPAGHHQRWPSKAGQL